MKKSNKFSLLIVLLFATVNTFSQCYTCSSNTPNSLLKASAFNYNSLATGLYSFTAGNSTKSSGESSTSFGSNTVASGLCSFAIGYSSTSSGNYGIALGHSANAYGLAAVSVGFGSQAANHSFAIGENSLAIGESSMSLGHYVTAGVIGAMVIGYSTNENVLVNNKSHSLMIGFLSKYPALYVGSPYPNSGEQEGRVGIATSNPLFKLHVEGNGYFHKDLVIGNSDYNAKLIVSSLKAYKEKQLVISDENGELSLLEDLSLIGDNLGNHTAAADLNLGDFRIYNGTKDYKAISRSGLFLTPENHAVILNNYESSLSIFSGISNKSSLWILNDLSGGFGFITNADNKSGGIYYNASMPVAIMNFKSNKVGIGCDPIEASNFNLFVKSGIETEEVLVKLQGDWSDYVFDNQYKLRSLNEVERYITINKHLPDIPSASEVKENGIKVGEMNALLLQKIEELTLYIIQQNKEIEILKEKLQ